MITFKTEAILGEDGKLQVEVPCGLPPGPVEVVVVLAPLNPLDKEFRWLDYYGLGKEIWEGIDAQEYVNQLREGKAP